MESASDSLRVDNSSAVSKQKYFSNIFEILIFENIVLYSIILKQKMNTGKVNFVIGFLQFFWGGKGLKNNINFSPFLDPRIHLEAGEPVGGEDVLVQHHDEEGGGAVEEGGGGAGQEGIRGGGLRRALELEKEDELKIMQLCGKWEIDVRNWRKFEVMLILLFEKFFATIFQNVLARAGHKQ